MDVGASAEVRGFLQSHRQAVLAVLDGDEPHTAMVSYALAADRVSPLIHLSNLSAHKRLLQASPRCSLLVAQPDPGEGEVLALARVSLQCHAHMLAKGSPEYLEARGRYLARLPTSEIMFTLGDFDLFSLAPYRARYVAGFGRALSLSGEQLRAGA